MSISVKNLTKVYGTQKAVDNITFEIPDGQIVGFLGPNGAGKTTTMKILTCFIPQTSGEATVNNFDVEKNSLEVRKSVGYLPEHNPLYKEMYIKEYLAFVAELHGIRKGVKGLVADMIEKTGLTIEQNKRIGQLSKGYRQRVGLAQALIHDPKVLILDEPTTGLDPNQITEIRNLIKEVGKDRTVILSTHIMQEVEAMCDRVIIINEGKIVADDSTKALRQGIKTTTTVQVVFKTAVTAEQLNTIEGVTTVKDLGGNKWELISNNDIDLEEAAFGFAVNNKLIITELKQLESSLESVFQQLTKK